MPMYGWRYEYPYGSYFRPYTPPNVEPWGAGDMFSSTHMAQERLQPQTSDIQLVASGGQSLTNDWASKVLQRAAALPMSTLPTVKSTSIPQWSPSMSQLGQNKTGSRPYSPEGSKGELRPQTTFQPQWQGAYPRPGVIGDFMQVGHGGLWPDIRVAPSGPTSQTYDWAARVARMQAGQTSIAPPNPMPTSTFAAPYFAYRPQSVVVPQTAIPNHGISWQGVTPSYYGGIG